MIKDIPQLYVDDIGIAITKEINEELGEEWNAYFVNFKHVSVDGVLVASTGYGSINGVEKKTSTLRHFLNVVHGRTAVKIEPVMEDVFSISNEYWASFYHNGNIYDKKYVFEPNTIDVSKFEFIEVLGLDGILVM
ncbi:MAG: hypothetical protein ABL940_03335 [Bacteroidia bacterium]